MKIEKSISILTGLLLMGGALMVVSTVPHASGEEVVCKEVAESHLSTEKSVESATKRIRRSRSGVR